MNINRLSLLVFSALAHISITASAQSYTITDFGTSTPIAINDSGTVVFGAGSIWSNGVTTYLPPNFHPTNINNSGLVVGDFINQQGSRAYVWSNGTLAALPVVSNSQVLPSQAVGVNNSNEIIGSIQMPAYVGGGATRAALWQSGVLSPDLHWTTLAGTYPAAQNSDSYGSAINDLGQVIGISDKSNDNHPSPFIYSNGQMTELIAANGADITNVRLSGINNAGTIIGSDFGSYGFVMTNGVVQALKFENGGFSRALGINDSNMVVGIATVPDENQSGHAFLFNGTSMIDLSLLTEVHSAGWTTLISANDINNAGQIIGYGVINGEQHGFLLAPVPEPETYAMLLAGLGLMGAVARRKQNQLSI